MLRMCTMMAKVGNFTQNIEMEIVIRPATPADAGTIAAYNAALAWETEHLRLDHQRLTAGVHALLAGQGRLPGVWPETLCGAANLPAQSTYTRLGMRPARYEMFEVHRILERGTGI
jgi:hypothetical protein